MRFFMSITCHEVRMRETKNITDLTSARRHSKYRHRNDRDEGHFSWWWCLSLSLDSTCLTCLSHFKSTQEFFCPNTCWQSFCLHSWVLRKTSQHQSRQEESGWNEKKERPTSVKEYICVSGRMFFLISCQDVFTHDKCLVFSNVIFSTGNE